VARIFTCAAQVAHGFVFDLWDIDRREIPRAHQPCPLDGITTISFDAITRLFRNQGGGHDPAAVAFFREIAVEPITTRASFVDEDEVCVFRLQIADKLVDIPLAGPDSAEGDDCGVVFFDDVGNGDRFFMDIQSDVERARLCHG
jgi:hypothetical protein